MNNIHHSLIQPLVFLLSANGETISIYEDIHTAERDMQICRFADEQNDEQYIYDIRALSITKEI